MAASPTFRPGAFKSHTQVELDDHYLIALPNRGKVGSLNVATAAAALVYGILHFRGETLDRAP